MKRKLKVFIALALALSLGGALAPAGAADQTYTAPYKTVRIGIYTFNADGSPAQKTFPSANLQYETGMGEGYDVGYYNSDREFVSIGMKITDTAKVSVLMDKNMVYGSNAYKEAGEDASGTVVGCVHLKLDGSFASYDEAASAAAQYEGGFVRYENGSFIVLRGQFTDRDDAVAAAEEAGDGWSVNSGSTYTVVLVATGTNRILLEFDCGTSKNLALRAYTTNGVKPQTWHRNDRYYGGFAFLRNTGGQITTVNYVEVEDYIKGVICYEMSPSWPTEALKAQAICARTFVMSNISKHRTLGYDLCNTTDCQAYHGTEGATSVSDRAVDETRGMYLMYDGKLCSTVYYSSSGGASEDVKNVWGSDYPYLKGVADPYETEIASSISGYYWTVSYTPGELAARLRSRGRDCSDIKSVKLVFTAMGNVKSITFTDVNGKSFTAQSDNVRGYPGCKSMRYTVNGLGDGAAGGVYVNDGQPLTDGLSGAYAIGSGAVEALPSGELYAITGTGTVEKIDTSAASADSSGTVGVNAQGKFVFSGAGWGHNVGMSQWGAYCMAKNHDKTYEDILTFYFTGTYIAHAPEN